jgi:phosphatidylserine/phosphatidylglycerophosphate/cardiolipin synthase-like enzyme
MSSVALYRAKGLARMGGGAYLFKGAGAADRIAGFPYADKVRWATHSKAMVVDGRTSIVGSTNFDPRSLNRINSEIGLVVPDNPAFAHALEHSIQNRIRESVKIDGDGRDSTGKKVETPNYINVLQFMKVGGLELLEDQL